ncbi:uncharacterized protein LOC141685668 [Apium graveolens]|uniref:uncharacterized protein LOC141685668 n=1 Tax=Apium graveolens TaxID=4045 RepID=UPI003D7AD0BF
MNAISWNCRGLGNPRAIRALWNMVKSHKPNILFLMETLSYKERIKHLCDKMGFDNHWTVECVSRSGGIALFWKSNVKCTVCNQGINFIDVQITNVNEVKWRLTGFYGFPERARIRESWGLLKMLAGVSDLPWVVLGDFNDMVNISDKKGNCAHPQSLLDGFKRTIEECGLIELELTGGSYTWEKSRDHSKKNFRFRFENTWLREENFHAEVTAHWKNLETDCADEDRTKRYFEEKKNLEDLMLSEEIYWQQRAKSFWLQDGDSNSRYFHAYATSRRKQNQAGYLKDESGAVINKHEEMCELVKGYFSRIFGGTKRLEMNSLDEQEAVITEEQNRDLIAEFKIEEFSEAIKQMHPDKSAGPDGLNPAFYQHFWGLFGKDKDNADEMKDLRPITLCNILYKVISKVLANRLKKILPGIISDNQSAFVPGRNITDNVLVAFELLHYMKQKKKGLEGEVVLKLDVSKAYDRVDWSFLMQ